MSLAAGGSRPQAAPTTPRPTDPQAANAAPATRTTVAPTTETIAAFATNNAPRPSAAVASARTAVPGTYVKHHPAPTRKSPAPAMRPTSVRVKRSAPSARVRPPAPIASARLRRSAIRPAIGEGRDSPAKGAPRGPAADRPPTR